MTLEQRLAGLAKRATPGPWDSGPAKCEHFNRRCRHLCNPESDIDIAQHLSPDDATYIAAISPATVLAMCEVIAAAREARVRMARGETGAAQKILINALAALDAKEGK